MRTHLQNLSPTTWALLGVPALIAGHSIVTTIIPWVLHAVVPEVVRTVLSVI
jgi:hypothetical protein